MENGKSRIYNALKKTYVRLIKIRGQPNEIALGFAMGIFIGMSPTVGLQMAIAVFFAALFKWNKVSAVIGVWISNPITIPFIYSLTYFFGANLLGITAKADNLSGGLDASTVYNMLSKAPEILWAMFVGGILIGLPLSLVGYYFCHSAVRKYQADIKNKLIRQKEKLAMKREARKTMKKKKKSGEQQNMPHKNEKAS